MAGAKPTPIMTTSASRVISWPEEDLTTTAPTEDGLEDEGRIFDTDASMWNLMPLDSWN